MLDAGKLTSCLASTHVCWPAYRNQSHLQAGSPDSLTVIPQATTEPNQTALTRNVAQPDLARPYWTVESSSGLGHGFSI